ncbi:MAG: hypothetical protein A3K60_01170 [Euryarchaeota archaeon RBG_19FT_COMBO_56_21]|nr:MAG: hypothetical protein A3K60_01170 [Euryarchaeota archaeon RBG_19FT_COMBO_56_21]
MIIRQANESDMPSLMKLEEECFGAERFSAEIVRAFVERDDTFVLAAVEGDDIIGSAMCIVSDLRREGRIASIAVVIAARRKGIGSKLLKECENAFQIQAALKFSLEVEATNEPAIKLYSGNGYEVKATLQDFYGPGRNAYYMEKNVDPTKREIKVHSA